MKKRIGAAVFLTGAGGIAAQLLVLRELLIVFSGNELSIGIILANWLVLEAFGCWLGARKAERAGNPEAAFAASAVLMSVSMPALVYLSRILRNILGISAGEMAGLMPVFYSSFLIILPAATAHGSLFAFGSRLYSDIPGGRDSPGGRVYICETAGTIAGGLLWTYIMIPRMNSFQSAGAVAIINMLACVILFAPAGRNALKPAFFVLAALLAASFGFLLPGGAGRVHEASIERQWGPHNVVHYENSVHGNITVIETEGQYSFFMDGMPAVSTPVPDIAAVEEFAHIPLLSHENPRRIVVLGGGAGGLLGEILKHPSVELVEYAELDPLILELIRKYSTPMTKKELGDPRVGISRLDGRIFIRKAEYGSDLILTGFSEPSDLQTNRFFTVEFFRLAKTRLAPGGIFAIRAPGSLTYIDDWLQKLNASIYSTLREVFPYVRVLPGDGTNMFLASDSAGILELSPGLLIERLAERSLEPERIVPWHIEHKLNPEWQDWFLEFIAGTPGSPNRDFRPKGVFYSIARWNALFYPGLEGAFNAFEKLSPGKISAFFAFWIVLALLVKLKTGLPGNKAVPFCAATTGFGGMVFELALIFAFQSVYGHVFHWLGLLVTSFMAGAASGAFYSARRPVRPEDPYGLFLKIEISIIVFSVLMPVFFIFLRPMLDSPSVIAFSRPIFLAVLFAGGALVGAQFPAAERLYRSTGRSASGTAGVIYGSDLLGGWLGGMAGGVVLLPVLGLFGACLFVFLLKLLSFVIILRVER